MIFSLSELGLGQAEADPLRRALLRLHHRRCRTGRDDRSWHVTFARSAPVQEADAPIVLPALHDAVAFIYLARIARARVRLEIAVDNGLPERGGPARLDCRGLGQVLTNLVTNAADAMGQQGTIRVSCRADLLRYPDAVEADTRPAVAVVDTGKGMGSCLLLRRRV